MFFKNGNKDEFKYSIETYIEDYGRERDYLICMVCIKNRALRFKHTEMLFQAKFDHDGSIQFPDISRVIEFTSMSDDELEDCIKEIIEREVNKMRQNEKEKKYIKEVIEKMNRKGTITLKREDK